MPINALKSSIRALFPWVGVRKARKLATLRKNWGGEHQRRSTSDAQVLYDYAPLDTEDHYVVDEQTWQDLDMNLVYQRADYTQTAPGAQMLWRSMRCPNRAPGSQDQTLVEQLGDNAALREELQMSLALLESDEGYDLPRLLWDELPPISHPIWMLRLLSWSLPLSFALAFVSPVFLLVGASIFLTNTLIEFKYQKTIPLYLQTLGSLSTLFGVARALLKVRPGAIEDEQRGLREALSGTNAIGRKITGIWMNDPLGITYYLKTIMLTNVIAFAGVVSLIRRRQEELRSILTTVGKIDMALSIASFRASLRDHCIPTIHEKTQGMTLEGIYHPCLSKPVQNDLDIGSNLLVMGSNMSGKSTFLKTVGVNMIMSQSIGTVAAKKFQSAPLRVMSSIDILDNLEQGRSYYLAEVESALRLVSAAGQSGPSLFILDEVFRGTNPTERVAAATAVLRYLGAEHLVLASTHDSEISQELTGEFRNVHFREELSADGFSFDYKVRDGASRSRNAIALLKHSGYPAEIVEMAESLVQARRSAASTN